MTKQFHPAGNVLSNGLYRHTFMLLGLAFVVGLTSSNASAQGMAQAQRPVAMVQQGSDAATLKQLQMADELLEQSQRAVKFYVQIMLDVETDRARTRKNEAVALVSADIDKLRREKLSPAQMATLSEIDATWSSILRPLSGEPSAEGLAALLPPNEKLVGLAEKLAESISKNVAGGDMLYLIGHQEMLVQRIARGYFVYHAGHKTQDVKDRVNRQLGRFVSVAESLSDFGSNSPSLKNSVDLVNAQVVFLRNMVQSMDRATKADWVAMSKLSARIGGVLESLREETSKQVKGGQ